MSISNNNFSNQGDVFLIQNNKRDRESEKSESDTSISSAEVKRKKVLNYFCGKGEKEWNPTSILTIKEKNITSELQNYRSKSIKHAEAVNDLSSMRILSLSYIFPINKYNKNFCTTRYLSNGGEELLRLAYSKIVLEKASAEALVYVHSLLHSILEGNDPEKISFEAKNEIDKGIKNSCLSLVEYKSKISSRSEPSFMDKHLMPFIRNIFLVNAQENLVFTLMDGVQNKNHTKPDIMIGVQIKKKDIYLFFVEVKRPQATSKYQAEDDFTKLMKHLKDSIDIQISIGIQEPKSYGVLCEGFSCSLYEMRLEEEGVYLAVFVTAFSLIENSFSLMNAITAVEAFTVGKSYIHNFEKLYACKSKKNKKIKSFKKPSFVTKFEK